MKINYNKYADKVKACWIGKNIGGTMGAPYEGKREYLDVKGFATEKGVVLPNDDLDLQLVWLLALEQIGPRAINARTLGEYWMSFITPYWNEYGMGKINMRRGLVPPLSGDFLNTWKDSNGAWIRTEIWASVCPGIPVAAARYAISDAKVDHGAGEGTYAAAFVAAMQSAAFVLNDIFDCIQAGINSIPEESRVYKTVNYLLDAFKNGASEREARDGILNMNADLGDGWFEAPSNIGYTVLGLLYGKGDFKKSMIAAINCGDDTDCTAATVGATLGILHGMKGIPEDWIEYIGDSIITISIAKGGSGRKTPQTCTDLTKRVIDIAPSVLYENRYCGRVDITDGEDEIDTAQILDSLAEIKKELKALKPYMLEYDCIPFRVEAVLERSPEIKENDRIGLTLNIYNNVADFADYAHESAPYNLNFKWYLPEGFSVEGRKTALLEHWTTHNRQAKATAEFTLCSGEKIESENRLVLEITVRDRATSLYIPIILIG